MGENDSSCEPESYLDVRNEAMALVCADESDFW
jgi:hypothetical protein